jgi:Salmonella virulence plasmid 65kDa B protein
MKRFAFAVSLVSPGFIRSSAGGWSGRLLAASAMLALASLNPAHAVVHTPGKFAVSETGAATYTVPLKVPPGTGGMQPNLSLHYSSQAGDGPIGVGWFIGGVSAIQRCSAQIAQDGFRGGINLNTSDRFCLDGQRLIAINGAYGANGTEYRTERESFTRVISYGAVGTGPAYFRAWTKGGSILEFGVDNQSAVTLGGERRFGFGLSARSATK